jgi:alpha-D-glucose phosphate-specific phosphoglucomutase
MNQSIESAGMAAQDASQADAAAASSLATSSIHFGTDGWRAIIGADFNQDSLRAVMTAVAQTYQSESATDIAAGRDTMIVGYDCRQDAASYAALAAEVLAQAGFTVLLSDAYCPTPTLCWSINRNPQAIGGVMLTSSHNPAEYLGVKLRMRDGGASPKEFSDIVETYLALETPAPRDTALDPTSGSVTEVDLMTPYLQDLRGLVDAQAIAAAGLKVVVDPLFGAGRHYLASVLTGLGVEVVEVNNACDPSFGGLHPEPIPPWIATGQAKVQELGFDACFVNDGDADRIGAVTSSGEFVSPHKIFALVTRHLALDLGQRGRVVRTLSGSNLIARLCAKLGLTLTTTPVGFKWIYTEMCKGDVMIGGEESGGIGIPSHVPERDGLLMALLLCELMATQHKTLGQLVTDLLDEFGHWQYHRRDHRVSQEQKEGFLERLVAHDKGSAPLLRAAVDVSFLDGVKWTFADDSWLLMRSSGTEPLLRIYAEALDQARVDELLDAGEAFAAGN